MRVALISCVFFICTSRVCLSTILCVLILGHRYISEHFEQVRATPSYGALPPRLQYELEAAASLLHGGGVGSGDAPLSNSHSAAPLTTAPVATSASGAVASASSSSLPDTGGGGSISPASAHDAAGGGNSSDGAGDAGGAAGGGGGGGSKRRRIS